MSARERKGASIDPRTGLLLLIYANIIAFSQKSFWIEAGWICVLALLLLLCGCISSSMRWLAVFFVLLCLQRYVLPVSPKAVATSFSIFINYARRMFPCLMVGCLMIKTIPLRTFIVGLRKLRLPQKLIIPISVTLRYFPAIKEEAGYILDAMRLRNIRGFEKAEALMMPLMISATGTAEELSAAAVTRGIENPVPKTSIIQIRMAMLDWVFLALGFVFMTAALWFMD